MTEELKLWMKAAIKELREVALEHSDTNEGDYAQKLANEGDELLNTDGDTQ